MTSKICALCNQELPIEDFGIKTRRSGKQNLQPYCKVCNREYHRNHYEKNKSEYLEKNKDYKTSNKTKMFEFLKEKSCVDCGNNDIRVLEFDHVGDKTATISKVLPSWSWKRLLTEIEKCDVVCANCHRVRTYERSGSYRNA